MGLLQKDTNKVPDPGISQCFFSSFPKWEFIKYWEQAKEISPGDKLSAELPRF
jgi:hypothetical protein